MPGPGEAVGWQQRQEDEETPDDILQLAAPTAKPAVSKDTVPSPSRKSGTGGKSRSHTNTGQIQYFLLHTHIALTKGQFR